MKYWTYLVVMLIDLHCAPQDLKCMCKQEWNLHIFHDSNAIQVWVKVILFKVLHL